MSSGWFNEGDNTYACWRSGLIMAQFGEMGPDHSRSLAAPQGEPADGLEGGGRKSDRPA
jgi:hypothetical protein